MIASVSPSTLFRLLNFPASRLFPLRPRRNASTLGSVVSFWSDEFRRNGISEPQNSAQLILAHVLGRKTLEGLSDSQRLSSMISTKMTTLAVQRLDHVPLQYVIGEWDFRQLTLDMRTPVFIPRPETEELVGHVVVDINNRLKTLGKQSSSPSSSSTPSPHSSQSASSQFSTTPSPPSSPLKVLEIGCGSGAICLSLLLEIPSDDAAWHLTATDVSHQAVDLTLHNASRLNLNSRLNLHRSSFSDAFNVPPYNESYDVIVSNPPYLPSTWLQSLPVDVTQFEDHVALFGGVDGLDVIRRILSFAGSHGLKEKGTLWLEVESSQDTELQRIVSQEFSPNLTLKRFLNDFRDVVRFVEIEKKR